MTAVLADLPEDLIDTTKAARLAKCHVTSVHRWIQRGQLRGWRRCGRMFVSQAELVGLFQNVKPHLVVKEERRQERRDRRRHDVGVERRLRAAGLMV